MAINIEKAAKDFNSSALTYMTSLQKDDLGAKLIDGSTIIGLLPNCPANPILVRDKNGELRKGNELAALMMLQRPITIDVLKRHGYKAEHWDFVSNFFAKKFKITPIKGF